MKRFLLVAGLLLTVEAHAQQAMPQPLPQTGGTTTTTHVRHHYPPLVFPATAARYDVYASFMVDLIRKQAGHGPITQGDVNKAVLVMKDCTSKIEAKGYVTQADATACNQVLSQTLHEIATPYVMQYAATH
jgi:hypothetical protein